MHKCAKANEDTGKGKAHTSTLKEVPEAPKSGMIEATLALHMNVHVCTRSLGPSEDFGS